MQRTILWALALLLAFAITVQPTFADDDKYKEKKYEKKERKDKYSSDDKKKSKYKDDDDDDYDHDDDDDYDYDDDDDYEDEYGEYSPSITEEQAVIQTLEQTVLNVDVKLMDEAALTVAAISKNNELLIPINQLYAYLDLRVEWFGKEQIMTLTKDTHSIYLKANKGIVYIDGKKQILAHPPVIENGSIYMPLQLLSDGFGLDVNQNGKQINLTWRVKEYGA